MTKDEKDQILALRREGRGYRAISGLLGIPTSTVSSFCKSHDDGETEVCPQCGAKITQNPHRKRKKFCSDKCRMLWWNSHLDQVNRQAYYKATCIHCGKEFVSYGNDHRKFCSRSCVSAYKRQG